MGFPGLTLDETGPEVKVNVFESAELPEHWSRLDEFEGSNARDIRQPVALEAHRVIIIEVVDADDAVPVAKKPPGEMRSDEAGDPGEDDLHGAPPNAFFGREIA